MDSWNYYSTARKLCYSSFTRFSIASSWCYARYSIVHAAADSAGSKPTTARHDSADGQCRTIGSSTNARCSLGASTSVSISSRPTSTAGAKCRRGAFVSRNANWKHVSCSEIGRIRREYSCIEDQLSDERLADYSIAIAGPQFADAGRL